MARLRARTYAYLIGIGTPMLLAGVLWWFRRQGGQAAPSDQLFALVIGAAMLGTAGILLKRSLPTLAASLALLILGFPQEVLGSVILPSGGLYLIAAFIVGLTDIGEMVGEGIEAGREGMEESGMNAPEMPSAFQDATDGGETEAADTPQQARPEAESLDPPEQPVPDAEAPDGPEQPVDADDVEPITAEDAADSPATGDTDETPDPDEIVEEHGPHHAPEVQVDQDRVHADDPSVGQMGGDEATDNDEETADATDADATEMDETAETDGPEMEERPDPDSAMASETLPPDGPDAEETGPVEPDPVETDETDDHGHPEPVRSVEPAGEESEDDAGEESEDDTGEESEDDADEDTDADSEDAATTEDEGKSS
jgi:hypothetical protein